MSSDPYSIYKAICENSLEDPDTAAKTIQKILEEAEDEVEDHEAVFMAWASKFRLAGRISIYEKARDRYTIDGDLKKDLTVDELGFLLMQEAQRACEQGFDLFFTDDQLGALGGEAVEAFRKVGATKQAELFSEVVRLYGDGPTGDQGDVLDAWEELPEEVHDRMEEIEEEFFELRFWSLYGFEWDWAQTA